MAWDRGDGHVSHQIRSNILANIGEILRGQCALEPPPKILEGPPHPPASDFFSDET